MLGKSLTRLSSYSSFFFPYVALNHREVNVVNFRDMFQVVRSIDKIKHHPQNSSLDVNRLADPPGIRIRLFHSFSIRGRLHFRLPCFSPHPALCSSMLVVRASRGRSFPPRFSRYRNWFIGGQSMNNSNRTIHSPINLGPKAACHTTRSLGEGSLPLGRGETKRAISSRRSGLMRDSNWP